MKDKKWFEDMEQRIPHGEVRTRFAPSPTGYMHVGNLRTALYTYLIARHAGGKFILRIEDTDQGRYVEGAVDVIYSTMRACGLTHDEGPDVGGPVGPYIQTERRGLYKEYAELLIARGHAYRCFCDKDDAAEENVSDGTVIHKYDGRCSRLSEEEIAANLAAGKPYVIRQKIPRTGKTTFHDEIFGDITVDNDTLDDQVLIKRDGDVQLSVNDAGQGRAVYVSGLPYSPQNARLLHRAVMWAAHGEGELRRWFSENPAVDVHAYEGSRKYCVVNNSAEAQSTTVYRGDGSSFPLALTPGGIEWFDME